MTTDYRTYPGDRNTRHTPAQRAAKVARAERKLADAYALLADVCADYTANGYRLTEADRTDWRRLAVTTDRLADARRNLAGK